MSLLFLILLGFCLGGLVDELHFMTIEWEDECSLEVRPKTISWNSIPADMCYTDDVGNVWMYSLDSKGGQESFHCGFWSMEQCLEVGRCDNSTEPPTTRSFHKKTLNVCSKEEKSVMYAVNSFQNPPIYGYSNPFEAAAFVPLDAVSMYHGGSYCTPQNRNFTYRMVTFIPIGSCLVGMNTTTFTVWDYDYMEYNAYKICSFDQPLEYYCWSSCEKIYPIRNNICVSYQGSPDMFSMYLFLFNRQYCRYAGCYSTELNVGENGRIRIN